MSERRLNRRIHCLAGVLAAAVALAAAALPIAAPRSARAAETAPAPGFRFEGTQFILDGKPFQIRAGELHFQRIPREYWRDRLLKARAMGLNTVGTYVFWNALEPEPGQWDFSGRNDVAAFVREAGAAGLRVLLRPGPYACAEWDFGGLPAWLLRVPDIRVRCSAPLYLEACERYVTRLAGEVRNLQVSRGGPILMVQLENEYGSFGNDAAYLPWLRDTWRRAGIDVPFYTADGPWPAMLAAGTVPGAAIGLDPAHTAEHFAAAERLGRGVPVFCSELYPGWLTHWGEPWARAATEKISAQLQWLLENGKSFSLYMLHGGTNFGFWAGANYSDKYEPDVTSYDYDAPLDERGRPTPKYHALRELIRKHLPPGETLPELPAPLPAIVIPELHLTEEASLWANLPAAARSPMPAPMEFFYQSHGFILYRSRVPAHASGRLTITELHDYANVYLDGALAASLFRGLHQDTVDIPAADPPQRLDILVEGMGRINYGPRLVDRKGITDRVTLGGMTVMDWEVFPLPFDAAYLAALRFGPPDPAAPPAKFFRGAFNLDAVGDTYLDMSGWSKGVVWVNGHNLGRYWNIGPQQRLFLPAPFLKRGANEVIVFDLHRFAAVPLRGVPDLGE